jgi:surface protein
MSKAMWRSAKISPILLSAFLLTVLVVGFAPLAAGSSQDYNPDLDDDGHAGIYNPSGAAGFMITVKTDNPGTSGSTQFTIPTTGGGYNYNVDCDNDGIDEGTGVSGNYTCTYGTAGAYTILITGAYGAGAGFPRIFFNDSGDKLKLMTIGHWGTGPWTSMAFAFYGCANLTITATDAPDLSGVANLNYMFADATAFNQSIDSWDTSNVYDMNAMFQNASAFDQDLTSWDTSNVHFMNSMFSGASAFNGDVSGWDTSKVTDMNTMFFNATAFNQDLSGWDTSKVVRMDSMFSSLTPTAFNGDISSWDTSEVMNMGFMFYNASSFNQDISGWDVSGLSSMNYMFANASSFNQDIGRWETGNVTSMDYMFQGATAFDQDIGSWDVTALTTAYYMFYKVKLSTPNYDALLRGWDAQDLNSGVHFHGGNSNFCAGAAARQHMIGSDGWVINDGGLTCMINLPLVLK